MRSAREKSADKGIASQRAGQQPDEAVPEHSLERLQQGLGNQAMLRLLGAGALQTKAKGSQPPAAEAATPPAAPAGAQAETSPAPAKAAPSLIVEDDAKEVAPGQMRKSDFLSQLRSAVCSTAEEALSGTMWSAMGCPYIERWLDHYSGQPGAYVERALRKYAPETASVRSAEEYIPLVTQRLRRGIEEWRSTGEVADLPEEFAEGGMPGASLSGLVGGALSGIGSAVAGAVGAIGGALSSVGSMLFKRHDGEAGAEGDPQLIKSQLRSGQALDSSVRGPMQSAFGVDFSGVRVHTDTRARELSEGMNARAFTIGSDIAFGADEYQPGTPVGDALIAHELAHVVQQGGGGGATMPKGGVESNALEADADVSAMGAVLKIWSGAKGALSEIGGKAMPRLKSGLRLQGCNARAPRQAEESIDLGAFWSAESLMQVYARSGDQHIVETIVNQGYTIISFETAYDTWTYDDGRVVEVEIEGLQGNTENDTKKIRILESLTTQQAASTLFHEVRHVERPASEEYLEQEINVRIDTERFLIRNGWPPFDPTYRNSDGTVNEQAIRDDIMGSSHYNPIGRHRTGRRYEGQRTITGWRVP